MSVSKLGRHHTASCSSTIHLAWCVCDCASRGGASLLESLRRVPSNSPSPGLSRPPGSRKTAFWPWPCCSSSTCGCCLLWRSSTHSTVRRMPSSLYFSAMRLMRFTSESFSGFASLVPKV